MSTCQAGGLWFKSGILPLLKYAFGENDRLLCWLYTPEEVSHQRECISRMPPQSSNKAEPTLALKPRGDVTRSAKQGYQWPHKWTCVQRKLRKKKESSNDQNRHRLQTKFIYFTYFYGFVHLRKYNLSDSLNSLLRKTPTYFKAALL